MQLGIVAHHIKYQVILIHLGILLFSKGEYLSNNLVETKDKDPYSNYMDVILN